MDLSQTHRVPSKEELNSANLLLRRLRRLLFIWLICFLISLLWFYFFREKRPDRIGSEPEPREKRT